MKIAFYGSSLLSSYWNGAATYYRGILYELAKLGHDITFFEPDAFDRQSHRDIDPPDWAEVVVWRPDVDGFRSVIERAAGADVIVKASGVGIFDDELAQELLGTRFIESVRVFWDVDAPATLAAMKDAAHPLRGLVPGADLVLTYGGGPPVVSRYRAYGARECVPIYNAVSPETHHPVPPDPRFQAGLAFLGNRLPDREARVEAFFIAPAAAMPDVRFLIGGAGWDDKPMPANIRRLGHVGTRDHNAFNVTPKVVLNISRENMAETGFSPATRVFEAAGSAACLITDAWEGIEMFLAPDREILVARDGADVTAHLRELTPERARGIGDAARHRVLREHTYAQRALLAEAVLQRAIAQKAQKREAVSCA